MPEKHIGKVVQVMGPVLDIRFADGELPELLNAIELQNNGKPHKEIRWQSGKLCCISHWIFSGAAPIIRVRKEVSGYDRRRNALGIRRGYPAFAYHGPGTHHPPAWQYHLL